MEQITKAWHFTSNTLRDGSPIPHIGEWLAHDGPAKMCQSGLHASKHVMNALKYAPGNILHFVECRDIVEEHVDKFVCRQRRIVESHDCEQLLRRFACDLALSIVPKNAPDKVITYLRDPNDEYQAAAREAAWDAAAWEDAREDASAAAWVPWAAAREAAWEAAWAASVEAAKAAARSSSWQYAKDAARVASWEDAWDAARVTAWTVAKAAASAAAWDAAMDELQDRVNKVFVSSVEFNGN